MRRRLTIVAIPIFLVLNGAVWGAVAINSVGPSVEELGMDIAEIDAEIAAASVFTSQYDAASVIGLQAQLRLATLQTTRAMLDQKRRSWFRGIDLVFHVDGATPIPLDASTITSLEQQRADAFAKAKSSRTKADLYTGGVIQALALVEEQTSLTTAAMVDQRLTMARIGLVFPKVNLGSIASPPPIGREIDDEGAL